MSQLTEIQQLLRKHAAQASIPDYFFKTGPGDYAQHDQFIGVNVPTLRNIAKNYRQLPLTDIQQLLESKINEERLLALFILVDQYQCASVTQKQELYNFYLNNIQHVNNWNLVDSSAHYIIGAQLLNNNKELLIEYAQSDNLWRRRITIIATWYFIRHNQVESTFTIAQLLIHDSHDLIHKAVGWMLREAGKKNQSALVAFLDVHAHTMPRTMLRYAIEKFSADTRATYLAKKTSFKH